jgi:serine/threonine-protein kinase
MAMPLIEGIAMTEVLRDRKAFMRGQYLDGMHWIVTMKESDYIIAVTKTLAKAVRALAMVHDLHIVHRDIKPANIMIDRNRPMGVFLCDFGLGRDLDVATPEQMRDGAGTPLYMAPERLRRELANEILCDIYSLGVTLFEATTLERPFRIQDNTPWSAVPAFLADSVAMRPSDVHPDFPRPLESIITRAMARDPNDRYPSAHAMAHDLDRYLATTQSPARTASIGTHAAPSVRGPHQNFRRPARPVPRRVAAVDSNIGCLSFIPVFEPGSSSSNMSREPKSPERQTG